MKISINRKPLDKPWGGGNMFVKYLSSALSERGHDVVFDLPTGVDVIIMIDPRYDQAGYSANEIYSYKLKYPNTKVLHRVNECDKRKGNSNEMDVLLEKCNTVLADKTVYISKWLKDYFGWKHPEDDGLVVYNGCDTDIFKPKAANNKKLRIVTHHWSDNWLKGFDIYKEIDQYLENNDDFEFTYVGRYSDKYKPRNTRIVMPLHGRNLAEELSQHDVYVTASRWEPCGMHHIEGAASGLPVLYHTEGGGIVEGCASHGLPFSSLQEFLAGLEKIRNNLPDWQSKIDRNFLSSKRNTEEFVRIIERMVS